MKKKQNDEITLDTQAIKKFFSRWKTDHLIVALLLIIAFGLVFWIRMLPTALPIADNWAEQSIQTNLRNQISAQVTQQYPNLPQENIDKLVNEQIANVRVQQADQIVQQKQIFADSIRSRLKYTHNGEEYTYLGDLDSYYWMRYTRNWLETGTVCDRITEEGICWDDHTLYPVGSQMDFNPSLHVFAIGYLHMLITTFNSDYPLPATSFLVPVLLSLLGVIPAFFIGKRLAGNTAGFFAAVIIALHPLVLSRSMGSDNDIWNVVIPLFVLWMAVEAVQTDSLKWRITAALLAGAFVALQSAAWIGWFFIYLVILIALIGAVVASALEYVWKKRTHTIWKEPKVIKSVLVLAIFYIGCFGFLSIAGTADSYFSTPFVAMGAGTVLDVAVANEYWPNVLTTVAELSESDISGVVAQMGGKLLFLLSMLGLLLLIYPRKIKEWHEELFAVLGGSMGLFTYIIYGSSIVFTGQSRAGWAVVFAALAGIWAVYGLFSLLGSSTSHTTLRKLGWFTGTYFGTYLVSILLLAQFFGSPPIGKLTVIGLIGVAISITVLLDIVRSYKISVAAAFMVVAWFVAAIYTSYSGVRFVLLAAPAFGIAFSITAGRLYEWISEGKEAFYLVTIAGCAALALRYGKGLLDSATPFYFIVFLLFAGFVALLFKKDLFKKYKWVAHCALFLVLVGFFIVTPVQAGHGTASNFTPSISDGWWNTLTKIEAESDPGAVINSWWDFGHWFKYVADRAVTADGTVQHTHVPRWLGLALVTADERESVGALRMLDCGSDAYPSPDGSFGAYGRTVAIVEDPLVAEQIVRSLLVLDRDEADKYLEEQGMTEEQRSHILESTHCDAPENYWITSGDMVGKAGVWAHFGLWDFEKAYIAVQARTNEPRSEVTADFVERFDWTEEQANRAYDEVKALPNENAVNAYISPWPGYFPPQNWAGCQKQDNITTICPLGIGMGSQGATQTVIDAFVYNATSPNSSYLVLGGYVNGQRTVQTASVPGMLLVAEQDELVTIEYPESGNGFVGVLFDPVANRVLTGDVNVIGSQFTQLFYLEGRYAKYYELFSDESTFSGSRILVWKVNWDEVE